MYAPVVLTGDAVAVLRVRVPDSLLREGVITSWTILALLAGALVTLAVAVTDRLGRSITRPATDLAATSRSLASGDLGARAEVAGPPEIAEAGVALNTLADRIDELLAAERERVADLSHRLRTPLTALRLSAEAQGASAITDDIDRLEREVSAVISAARRPLHTASTRGADLGGVARSRAEFWSALAADDGRSWSCSVEPAIPLPVEPSDVQIIDALDALIGNVFAHTPEGVAYAITVQRLGDHAVLTVDDAGPGVANPAAILERGVSAGGSTGLGLDIASRVATDAGGTLRIERSPLGGARIVVELPIAGDRSAS